VRDRLQLGERRPYDRELARAADRHVQRGVRRADDLVANEQLGQPAGALECLAWMERDASPGKDCLRAGRARLHERVRSLVEQWVPAVARLGARRRVRSGRRRVWLGVEQHCEHVDGADPVDEAVVRLLDEPPAAVLEPVDQHELPQRARSVERLREQLADQVAQLGVASRRR
jgi:hypothetical protein